MIDKLLFYVNREIEGAKAILSPECRPLLFMTIVVCYFAWTKFGVRELVWVSFSLIKRVFWLCVDVFRYFRTRGKGHEE